MRNLIKVFLPIVAVLAILALVACGGGGGGSGPAAAGGSNPAQLVITGTPAASTTQDATYAFTPSVSDPDNGNLSFTIMNQPTWANFDASTGALTGTPAAGDVGTYADITITVSASSGSASLDPFTITVNQIATGSVTVSWVPPTMNEDGSGLNDLAGYRIYHGTSEGDYPNMTTVSNPGLTTYLVENLSPNTYFFVATAYDTSGNESDQSSFAQVTLQ